VAVSTSLHFLSPYHLSAIYYVTQLQYDGHRSSRFKASTGLPLTRSLVRNFRVEFDLGPQTITVDMISGGGDEYHALKALLLQ
jgi:hypothetical protein